MFALDGSFAVVRSMGLLVDRKGLLEERYGIGALSLSGQGLRASKKRPCQPRTAEYPIHLIVDESPGSSSGV
jgi:hypothetical protein